MSFTNIRVTKKSEHQEIWNLLPWYVNHSLKPAEHELVKNHVKICITCRIELNQQQLLFNKIQQTDLLQQVSQASFTLLKKRLNSGHSKHSPTAESEIHEPQKGLKTFLQQLPGFVKYTALAASLLLLATLTMLNLSIETPELRGEYRTLSSSPETEQKYNIVRVVFADQSELAQIQSILNNVSGRIVKGPSQNGVYEVQIGNHQTNSQELIDALSQLRSNPRVVFAEQTQGLLSSN